MPRSAVREDEGRLGIPSRVAVLGLLIAGLLAAPATADIYWANEGSSTIGRAENDGTGVVPAFVGPTDATSPHAVAVDLRHLYWAHNGDAGPEGNIGRAPLVGGTVEPTYVETTSEPMGLTLDQAGMYWTQPVGTSGSIGRANIFNGAVTNQNHVPNIGASPCGLVYDADKFFWALGGAPDTGMVMRIHGIFPPLIELVPGMFPADTADDPCGIAEAEGFVYWADRGTDEIGSVNVTGTTLGPTIDVDAGDPRAARPCGVAVDGSHIYWTEQGTDQISRADLDGTNVNPPPNFPIPLPASADPCGIAVDPTAATEPVAHSFGETTVGSRSDIATLVLHNTSSSTLDPTAVNIVGTDAGEFVVSGDGCTINIVPVDQLCVINAEFVPTSVGTKSAVVRVVSNASNSPTDFALTGTATAPPSLPPPADPPPTLPIEPEYYTRTLSISYSRRGNRFKGTLGSEKTACLNDQQVVVLKRKRGDDARVGADDTDAAGRWRVAEADPNGRYYAQTAQSVLAGGPTVTCFGAKSENLRVR